MRILHTSDWHLGQHFMGKTREAEHNEFIQWLLRTVEQESVDALIIAGDIFDTATPPSYARAMYNRFVVRLQKTCCNHLVIVGGNHDSVATLNESKELLACLNTTVIGGLTENPEDQVITLRDQQGQRGAVICAIPFIRPREVLESRAGEQGSEKQQALQTAIAQHYKNIFHLAQKQANSQLPIIATGHLTTVGGQVSDSEREIYIGSLSAFPSSAFPKADYIALGHLHRGQIVAGQEHVRYCGSPIALSFSEASGQKQVLLVDFERNQLTGIKPLEIPAFRNLQVIKGSLEEIEQQLKAFPETEGLTPWLDVEVATEDYLTDLHQRVEELIQGCPVELLRVRKQREQKSQTLSSDNKETLAELNVDDVFSQRLQQEEIPEETMSRLTQAFQEIVVSVEDEPVQEVAEIR